MFIGKEWSHKWVDKKGKITYIKDMDDKHLMLTLFYVQKLAYDAYPNVNITESIADNVPYRMEFKPDWCMLLPSYYFNARTELIERGLYR